MRRWREALVRVLIRAIESGHASIRTASLGCNILGRFSESSLEGSSPALDSDRLMNLLT